MSEPALAGWKASLDAWRLPDWGVPILLLLICVASYGLLIPALGFYWDDFPISWIGDTYGSAGLERYFSTNRPYWGWLYRLTVPLLGSQQPVVWQLFNLFWRWLSAVALWGLLRLAWPRQIQVAAWAALLFTVFPAFRQQPIALLYSHFFIILTLFLVSQVLTLWALRRYRGQTRTWGYWLLTALALLLSLYNLLAMEYFFILELVRAAFIWVALSSFLPEVKPRASQAFWLWLPYLAVFAGAVIWRMFFFSFQTQNYEMIFFQRLQAEGAGGLLLLTQNILASLWAAGPGAWLDVFKFAWLSEAGKFTLGIYLILIVTLTYGLGFVFSHFYRGTRPDGRAHKSGEIVIVGLLACLLAGWPFWLIEVLPSAIFPLDRFTLPFALGISLVGAGLASLLDAWPRIQIALLAVLFALAVGFQFRITNEFREEWKTTQRFFWQLSWRVPALEPGTLVMAGPLPMLRYSDNSLTAPLNRIYAPANSSEQLAYLFYYPEQRLGKSLVNLQPGNPITVDYLAAQYHGNTSQALVLVYAPPGCVRILDPELDGDNRMLPELLQQASPLSDVSNILPIGQPSLVRTLFGLEPDHGWCYYFERADLARQQGNWEAVVALGEQAFSLGDYPNDPSERIPFIEAYAHVEMWEQAVEQTRLAAGVAPAMELVVCNLWQRIEEETITSTDQAAALDLVRAELNCAR